MKKDLGFILIGICFGMAFCSVVFFMLSMYGGVSTVPSISTSTASIIFTETPTPTRTPTKTITPVPTNNFCVVNATLSSGLGVFNVYIVATGSASDIFCDAAMKDPIKSSDTIIVTQKRLDFIPEYPSYCEFNPSEEIYIEILSDSDFVGNQMCETAQQEFK